MADIVSLHGQPIPHRQAGAAPPFKQWLDPEDLARATRDGGMETVLKERLNRPDLYDSLRRASADQRDYDTDLRIIGWGLAAAALWVVCFRLGQLAGMLS